MTLASLDAAEYLLADDLEHERILAAVNHKLFGHTSLRLGPFRVIRLLGAGGMGEVFLARDETLERSVAIKVLDTDLGAQLQMSMLQAEGRALARLSHPNVVQIHEFGEHAGRAYVVMEYVAGPTLRQWLEARARGPIEILEVYRSAGAGLAAAHAAGVVHRDFKPDNVLIGEDGRVRVVDFGLAAVDRHAAERVGTPRYMAPEQREGSRVDARSDQYSFCAALHEALWGELPPRDGLADHRVSGSRWIWRRLRRGLDPDPERRWPDLDSLLEALDPHPRRRRFVLAGVGALSLAALTAWGLTPELDRCERPASALDSTFGPAPADTLRRAFAAVDAERGPAEAELLWRQLEDWSIVWRRSQEQLCRSRRAGDVSEDLALRRGDCLEKQRLWMEDLVVALGRADRRTLAQVRELASEIPSPADCEEDEVLQAAALDDAQKAEVDELRQLLQKAQVQRITGHPETNLAVLNPIREQVFRLGYAPLIAEYDAELASAEFMAGSPERGRELLEEAANQAIIAGDRRLVANSWTELSWHAVTESDDPDRAQVWLEQARAAWAVIGEDADAKVKLAYAAGAIALERDDYAAAERELEAAMVLLDESSANEGFRPFVLERQAILAEAREDPARGLELRARAREASELHFGPNHQRTWTHGFGYGLAALEAGQVEIARRELDLGLARWRASGAREDHRIAEAYRLHAGLLQQDGEPDHAIEAAGRQIQLLVEFAPDVRSDLAKAHYNYATIAFLDGDYETAAAGYAAAIPYGGENTGMARVYRGLSLLELGELEQARESFGMALGLDDPDTVALARLFLAVLELRSQRLEAARAQLEQIERERVDELELELVTAVLNLRSGESPPRGGELSEASEEDRAELDPTIARLGLSEREREELGLDPRPTDSPAGTRRSSRP